MLGLHHAAPSDEGAHALDNNIAVVHLLQATSDLGELAYKGQLISNRLGVVNGCAPQSTRLFGHDFTPEVGASSEWLFHAGVPQRRRWGRGRVVQPK